MNKATASEEIGDKNLRDRIYEMMLFDHNLRNDDRSLIIEIWDNDLPHNFFNGVKKSDWTLFPFFYAQGKLTSSESICRIARDVRKKNGWKIPKKEEENKVKQVLKYESNLFPSVDLEFLNIRK